MGDNFWFNSWTEEELHDAYVAWIAEQLRSVDNGTSSSQLQQNNHLPSDTVNSGGDPSNSATGQPPYNASFNHARSPFSGDPSANNPGLPGNVSESYPNEDHPYSVYYDNQPESHASDRLLVCKWRDSRGPCGKNVNEEEVADHMSSSHLPPPSRATMKCQWDGCKLKKHICRDTILRHIRQIHLTINLGACHRLLRVAKIMAGRHQHPQPY